MIGECIVRERNIPDQIGLDLKPAVELACGYYIGERCLQQRNDEFAVTEDQEDVGCRMGRMELCIGQHPLKTRGLECRGYLRRDPAFDREVDQLLPNVAKKDVRHHFGPEFGVMFAKLSGRLGVVEMLYTAILDWIDGREQSIRCNRGHTLTM